MISYLIDRLFIKIPRLRWFMTKMLEGDKNKQVELCGTSLTINTIKEHGYLRASRIGQSSGLFRDEVSVLINLAFILEESDTFIDIGANVGFYTKSVARFTRIMPNLKLYAFEANPDTYLRLLISCANNVHTEQVALSDHEGELEFVLGGVSHTFTTSEHASSYNIKHRTISVPCKRLDECGVDGNSLVIKIDVEGQELAVLLGASKLLEAGRVKAVYFDGYKDRKVEEILKQFGFQFFNGRTLEPVVGEVFSLLAIHPNHYPRKSATTLSN